MTDDEIEDQAPADPDNFENHDSVTLRVPDVRVIRERLGFSQEDFAHEFGLNRWHVKHWESGEEILSWGKMLYLHVIDAHPEAVIDSLAKFHLSRSLPVEKTAEKKLEPMPGIRRKSA